MDECVKNDFELGFEAGVRRMAAKLRNYIISNPNTSGGAVVKIRDVERLKREILKSEKENSNE